MRALLAVVLLIAAASATGAPRPGSTRDMWPQIVASATSGDIAGADTKLNELFRIGKVLGIRRFPVYAKAAAGLAAQSESAARPDVAAWAASAARKLDPHSPAVSLASSDRLNQRSGFSSTLRPMASGVRNVLRDRKSEGLLAGNLMLLLAGVFSVFAAAVALLLFIRYSRRAIHDLQERLERFPSSVSRVMAICLLFLPVFLWLGPAWLAIFWLVIFFPYARTMEKGLTLLTLLLIAAVPFLLNRAAHQITGSNSPVVRSAVALGEGSYDPELIKRVRELATVAPSEADVHFLLAGLELQEGNLPQALAGYKKATELNPRHAGAHLNMGNLYFMQNDPGTALSHYEKAAEANDRLALAYYNESVASGELYRFDQQAAKIEQAKKIDRSLVNQLEANPPPEKVANFAYPVSDSWGLARHIARSTASRDLFGNAANYDPLLAVKTPVGVGALLGLVVAPLLARARKRRGTAGTCIKCGRTFCPRCKSSLESATYCTQCIHIYLKRDGVSIDTKRDKVGEVQAYQTATVRLKKLLGTFLPGAAQIFGGATVIGAVIVFLFIFAVLAAVAPAWLAPVVSPSATLVFVLRVGAIALAVILWLAASAPVYLQKPGN